MEIVGAETRERDLVPHGGSRQDPRRSPALRVSIRKVMESDPGAAPIHDELLPAGPSIDEARMRVRTAHRVATGRPGTLCRPHARSG